MIFQTSRVSVDDPSEYFSAFEVKGENKNKDFCFNVGMTMKCRDCLKQLLVGFLSIRAVLCYLQIYE